MKKKKPKLNPRRKSFRGERKMSAIVRKIPLSKTKILLGFPCRDDIPGREDRDFLKEPPTYNEALFTLITFESQKGFNFEEGLAVYNLGQDILKHDEGNDEFINVPENLYQKYIYQRIQELRFAKWTQEMIDFISGIRDSERVNTKENK